MCSSLATLPAELYSKILSFVPSEELQWTTYALALALPSCPVPTYHVFTYVRLTYTEQAFKLYLRLSKVPSPAHLVCGLSLETWSVDADIFTNVVKLLPNLESLSLHIGPNNFSPEHLEELFSKPETSFPQLKYLGLRFRPYVQKATYIQFLKGTYFDSTLAALSRWPQSCSLPVLSIVQDPLDSALASKHLRQSFAQPIVFFRLDVYLSVLLHSQTLARSLNAFRLRIPSRAVARPLCTTPTRATDGEGNLALGEVQPIDVSRLPPMLKYLDLSTCGVLEGEVDMILLKYPTLEHLVLDHCSVLRGELREGEWAAMGKRCALIGVRRAKEREKKVKAWLETNAEEEAEEVIAPVTPIQRARRGRRGLATSTISIRDREPRHGPLRLSTRPNTREGRIRILPPLPRLRSLSTTTSPVIGPDKHSMIRSEFESGWMEGVALLRVTRARLIANVGSGVRVMEFRDKDCDEEEGLGGLKEASFSDDPQEIPSPVLCLAGGDPRQHQSGCGHEADFLFRSL